MTTVHIRNPHVGHSIKVLCGATDAVETISYKHYVEHLAVLDAECCASIVARLCRECAIATEGIR